MKYLKNGQKGEKMVNTYHDNENMETKMYEEIRCLRCVLERILRTMDESLFVDYQMEKYGKDFKSNDEFKAYMNRERTKDEIDSYKEADEFYESKK